MAQATVKIRPPELHEAQAAVATSPARHKILICGRRWGKTLLGVSLGIFGSPAGHRGAIGGGTIWWIAPTYQASRLAFDMASSVARAVNRRATLFGISRGLMEIRTAAGGVVAFKSADRPDNLRGASLDGAILDEADFQPETVYRDVVYPMLVDRRGWSLLVSTPRLENGWLHRLYKAAEMGDVPETAAFSFPTSTNPYIDPAELERARVELGDISYQREFEARWVSAEGAILKAEWLREVRDPGEILRTSIGVDLAISKGDSADYTAFVCVGKTETGFHVLGATRFRGGLYESLERLQAFADVWDPDIIVVESNAYQAAFSEALLRKTSLPVRPKKARGDKPLRFSPVAARYEAGLVTHSPTLPRDFIDELLAFPLGEHDDYVDALVYAYSGIGEGYDWVSKL